MPWPVPCPKWSPWPAASMTPRATASIARPLGSGAVLVRRDGAFQGRDRLRLRPGHERVDVEVARRGLADEQRPGHVAPVARDLRAEVEQQDRVRTDRPVAGRAVRQRRLRPGQAGDVERERLGATGPHQPLEAEREVRLGHAGPDLGEQRRQCPVGDRAGRARSARSRRAPWSPGRPRSSPRPGRARRPVRRPRAGSQTACETNPASTATRRAPTDAISSGQRLGRSWYASNDPGLGRLAAGLDRVARIGRGPRPRPR